MKVKLTVGERIFNVVNVILCALLALCILVPILNIVFASFSDPVEVMKHEGLFLHPIKFSTQAYQAVAKNPNILSGYMNTLFVVVIGTSLNIVLTLIGSYVLSRKGVMLNRFFTLMIVFTMYFQGGTIPFYLTVHSLGLTGSRLSLIFPVAINTFNLIVMRTAMASVPDSLPESAMMDGAGHVRILFSIMTPLTKATVAVITLYYAVYHWNSWFNAMIFLHKKAQYPLQLILREILIQDETSIMSAGGADALAMASDTIKYATIVVATVPILCIYPFLQKYFVKGVMVGAVKG
ncbi:MAG: carbohydrate ABC transporter permease [Sphaerochaetaceae bacterium]|nr:carbohydrate ABC transporter permease [Sphaerochaetaceae bacterium]